MNKDSPQNALLVVLVTALVCSSLVSAAVVLLRPIQLNNQLLEQSRNIMQLTGLLAEGNELDDDEMLGLYKSVDRRIVNIDEATFDEVIDPNVFDKRKAVNDPELGVQIPAGMDVASLGRRSRFAPVYIVWNEGGLERVIFFPGGKISIVPGSIFSRSSHSSVSDSSSASLSSMKPTNIAANFCRSNWASSYSSRSRSRMMQFESHGIPRICWGRSSL